MSLAKFRVPCDLCATSLKKGQLWLSGADYLVCPQCEGTGEIEIVAERTSRRARTYYQAGQRPRLEIDWRLRSNISGRPVPFRSDIVRR